MKIQNDLARKALVMLFASLTLLVSCNDEGKLDDGKDEGQVQIADSLSKAFAAQTSAMRALVSNPETGLSYAVVRTEGGCQVALTDENVFVSYPESVECYPLLSCLLENGTAFWALMDKDGGSQALTGSDGNKIPVTEVVELKLTSKGYQVVAAGQEFDTVFSKDDAVQAFLCDFHMDADSKIYAVTFKLGEDFEKTLFSRGYTGVGFKPDYGVEPDYISEYYVDYSASETLVLDIPAGVEWSLEVTEGWRAVSRQGESVTYIDLTAPAKDAASENAALKVIADECDVTLAELALVNDPFKSFLATANDVLVEPFTGVRKFVYGVVGYDEFDSENVLSASEALITGGSETLAGCALADEAVKTSISELLGADVDTDNRYVLWAVPALYREGEPAGYYVEPSTLCTYEFGQIGLALDLVEAKIMDAEIKVVAKGIDAVYGGVVPKSDGALELVASQLRNGAFSSLQATEGLFEYEGSMKGWAASAGENILPSTTYLVWVAPAFEGEYPYEVEDVVCMEVTTNSVVEGGSVAVVLGEAALSRNTMSVQVDAFGASVIYYALLSKNDGDKYSGEDVPNSKKFEILMKNSPIAYGGSSVLAEIKRLNPNNQYWIFAVAIDAEGKYGQVEAVSGTTESIVFDSSIKLTVEALSVSSNKAVLKVTSNGGNLAEYVYWVGRSMDPFWTNRTYCGGSKSNAQKYMSMYPDDENIKKTMNKYGPLAADGTITIDDMTMETDYIFVILEKGETEYSQAGYIKVTTLSADLGEVVREGREDRQWEKTKDKISIDWHEDDFSQDMEWARYSFSFNCPDTLTAYVLCASVDYFEDAGLYEVEHQMIDVEQRASKKYPVNITPSVGGQQAHEPDYYKDGDLTPGQLMNVYVHYAHGVPQDGYVTYFAPGAHGDDGCPVWENGQCSNYQSQLATIQNFCTLTPWLDRAKSFGLVGKEAQDWAEALRDAYSVYYEGKTPIIFENDGQGITITNPYAMGVNEDNVVPDRVIIMFKDLRGNYYEPMIFEVPNHFKTVEE